MTQKTETEVETETVETPAVESGDEFSAAFEKLTTPGEEPAKTEEEPAKTEEVATEESAAKTEEEPAKTEEVAKEEPKPAAGGDDDDAILNRLAQLVKETPKAEEKPAAAETPTEETPAIYTDDEQEFLAEYDKEWGDVARGEALKRRAEYQALVGHVFSEVMKVFQPVQETVDALAGQAHLSRLTARVENYDETREGVINWVKSQPDYLQAAYNRVIQAGTEDEVVDLIDRYRKETGVSSEKPQETSKTSELPAPAKQAAADLAPVKTRRTVIESQEDKSNFDAAFEKFAKTV